MRTRVLHRLGVRSGLAARVNTGFRATGPRFRKSPVIRHKFRRLHGLVGTGAALQTPQAKAAAKIQSTARARAKAAVKTAQLRNPANRELLRQAARTAALSRAKATVRKAPVPKSTKPKAPKRPAKQKPSPSGAPISTANYLNMF